MAKFRELFGRVIGDRPLKREAYLHHEPFGVDFEAKCRHRGSDLEAAEFVFGYEFGEVCRLGDPVRSESIVGSVTSSPLSMFST